MSTNLHAPELPDDIKSPGDLESSDDCGAPDWFFRSLVTALAAVAIWLLAMPWVPAIARCTMQRFHLKTPSFAAWAIQQPIPPMYSFANTAQVRSIPSTVNDGQVDPLEEKRLLADRMINHFPTRMFTFANGRARYLLDDSDKLFVFRSTYRGQVIESTYRLETPEEGNWVATRIGEEES